MNIDFSFFNTLKPQITWTPIVEWIKGVGTLYHFAWKGLKSVNGVGVGVPLFFAYVNVEEATGKISISLYANILRDINGKGQKQIDNEVIDVEVEGDIKQQVSSRIFDKYGIDSTKSVEFEKMFNKKSMDISLQENKPEMPKEKETKLLNRENMLLGTVKLYKVRTYSNELGKQIVGFQIQTIVSVFKNGKILPHRDMKSVIYPTYARAENYFNEKVASFKDRGFVDLNEEEVISKPLDFDLSIEQLDEILGEKESKNTKNIKKAQSEWYSGSTPDPKKIEQFVGTPSVEASQIKSIFVGVDDAISLVNRFDSSLLLNVGLIFNFSNQGAYGVYLPMLDDQIKREKIKTTLKQEGCEIKDNPDGSFYSYSKTKTPEEIQKEIDSMYDKLKHEGGSLFGINMNKVLTASKMDADAMGMTAQEDINDIITLHLGATFVHEAIHAKGSTSEGPSEQGESKFFNWALPIINQKRLQRFKTMGKENEFAPLTITQYRRSFSRNWYKFSQNSFPTGAQFSAEMPYVFKDFNNFNYGLMFGNLSQGPIESMLQEVRHIDETSRDFSLEKKMCIQNKDPAITIYKDDFITENLLQKDRKDLDGYKSIEKSLEDQRPKPIILPKEASSKKMTKTATLFGWFSNLDLPMRERVIPGYDSDEFLTFDWDEIRKLPRYNYDGKAYEWFEPRFEPELWDQMISRRPSNITNPARRFAQIENREMSTMIKILNLIQNRIELKKMFGTRIVCSEDMVNCIDNFFKNNKKIKVLKFQSSKFQEHDGVIPIWIYRYSIPELKIQAAENFFCKKDTSEMTKQMFDYITGKSSEIKKEIINTILNMTKNVCKQYSIEDVFIVGGFPRSVVMKESWNDIHDLDFASAWTDQCIKFGEILADVMGVSDTELFHRTMTLSWEWMGIKCDFKGNYNPVQIRNLLRKHNIKTTPLNLDIYSRDFTINMLVYDLMNQKIYDVCKKSVSDIKNKILRTCLPEISEIVQENAMIILRALKYIIRYDFVPEPELELAIKNSNNQSLLFDGRYTKERIGLGFLELIMENEEKAKQVIENYGLTDRCKEYISCQLPYNES